MAASGEIADLFINTITTYAVELVPAKYRSEEATWSDHSSFWDAGYPAIVGIEADDDFNPYYHSVDDTRDQCNLGYAANYVKAAIGTLARIAIPVGVNPTPGPTPTPGAHAGIAMNGASFTAGDAFDARFELYQAIRRPFAAYAVIVLPDGSMRDAATRGPVRPVAEFMPAMDAPFTHPLLATTVPAGAPTGAYEIVAAFFDPYVPITDRGDAFMEAARTFTIR
jgi:hypothetical protein